MFCLCLALPVYHLASRVQVDNARDLVSMGGMKLVIDTLNGTDLQLQESAAFVLGSAVSR